MVLHINFLYIASMAALRLYIHVDIFTHKGGKAELASIECIIKIYSVLLLNRPRYRHDLYWLLRLWQYQSSCSE